MITTEQFEALHKRVVYLEDKANALMGRALEAEAKSSEFDDFVKRLDRIEQALIYVSQIPALLNDLEKQIRNNNETINRMLMNMASKNA